LHNGSGVGRELPKADAIYVCAAATGLSWAWIDALLPGGRLMFPLAPEFELSRMLRVTRPQAGDRWPAMIVSRARFIGCTGLQGDSDDTERLVNKVGIACDRCGLMIKPTRLAGLLAMAGGSRPPSRYDRLSPTYAAVPLIRGALLGIGDSNRQNHGLSNRTLPARAFGTLEEQLQISGKRSDGLYDEGSA